MIGQAEMETGFIEAAGVVDFDTIDGPNQVQHQMVSTRDL